MMMKGRIKASMLLCLLSLLQISQGREEDERSKFLYVENPAAKNIIWDYEPHMHAPHFIIEDLSEKHKEFAERISTKNSTEESVQPFFLRNDYPIRRIVQLYSPWCGHCQKFVPRYITVARNLLERLPKYHLEFFAISCSEHHMLCQHENVRGYPTLRAYPPNSNEYIPLEKFTPESIDLALDLDLQHRAVADSEGNVPSLTTTTTTSTSESNDEQQTTTMLDSPGTAMINKLDILGATTDGYQHTRTDVYRDAALSFTYALENHIFYEDQQTELTEEQKSALSEWLDLLYWTLPPTWMLHTLINELRVNLDVVARDKQRLLLLVKAHRPVVHDKKKEEHSMLQWSRGCRNGQDLESSFSCGLWCLFHIVSVGVPERHRAVLGHRHRVSTKHAAETVKNYVQHFFAWCPQCREQYLQLFKSCAYNHCRRFRQIKGNKRVPSQESWVEFPVWLWQIHNEINEKLMAKEALRKHKRKPTTTELERARWPPPMACERCFTPKGQWIKEHVYNYIREEYWPSGIHNFRFVVLDKLDNSKPSSMTETLWELFYDILHFLTPARIDEVILVAGGLLFVFGLYVVYVVMQKRLKQQRIKRTGRHKKYDFQPIFDVDA